MLATMGFLMMWLVAGILLFLNIFRFRLKTLIIFIVWLGSCLAVYFSFPDIRTPIRELRLLVESGIFSSSLSATSAFLLFFIIALWIASGFLMVFAIIKRQRKLWISGIALLVVFMSLQGVQYYV